MEASTIQNLIGIIEKAFWQLDTRIPNQYLEDLAITIHRVLSSETRHFHTSDHVFSLTDPEAPIRSLAAVFHDLVYYQVDRGFPEPVHTMLAPYLRKTESDTVIAKISSGMDRAFELLQELFAMPSGQAMSNTNGINEFFSALVAWKKLEDVLPENYLLQIAVHIEGTIPFRGPNKDKIEHFDALAERMKQIGLEFGISLSETEIEETLWSAVQFANQDVAGFANSDPAIFLDNTWKLLPEGNTELRSGNIYSIREYRQALQKMEAFFNWLEPKHIFHGYKGVPNDQELQQMTAAAHRNINLGRAYLGVKLLAIAVIEALAEITGGDAPLALFMGDIQANGKTQQRLENYLPSAKLPASQNLDPDVYQLLVKGRSGQSQFDLENAPLASYLYKSLSWEGCENLLSITREMFEGGRSPSSLLAAIDPSVISTIAQACAQMVPTRRDLLMDFASKISVG